MVEATPISGPVCIEMNPSATRMACEPIAFTMLQMTAVIVALSVASGLDLPRPLHLGLNVLTGLLTLTAGVQYLVLAPRYVVWGSR